MADDDHPRSERSKKRQSIASAPNEDARSHRMSTSELPSGQELQHRRQSRASEPGPITSPIAVIDSAEASKKPPSVVHPFKEETAPEPQSGAVKSPTTPPRAQSAKSTPKSPGRQSVASQPKSPEKQPVPKSPGKQLEIVPPKSPGRQSLTVPPKSPSKQSVTAPKSPGRVSVTSVPKSLRAKSTASVPKSPSMQSAAKAPSIASSAIAPKAAPSAVTPLDITPSVMAPPVSPGKHLAVAPPPSPGIPSSAKLSVAAPNAPPAQVEVTSIAPASQQPEPIAPQATEPVPPSEHTQIAPTAAGETLEYAGGQVASAAEETAKEVEPIEEALQIEKEVEESQEIEKQELLVNDVLFEITGLESASFQGYMGSLIEFLCTQCKRAVYTYWKTPCNHQFCEICRSGAVSDEFFTCSVEGTQINVTELVEAVSDLDKLKEAEVFCLNKTQGCKEKYPIKNIKDHLENCYYTFFPCPQNCGETIIRKDLGKHLTEDCQQRVYFCELCETDVQEIERTVHDELCEKKPPASNCEFCGSGPIERSDMELHYQDCLQKPQLCRMASIGCTFVGTKEEADCHESFDNHRELITTFIQEQKETVTNLEQEKNETKLQLSEALGKLQNIDLINRYLAVKVGILEEVPYVQKEMEEENKFLKGQIEQLLNKQLTHEEQISRMTEYCAGRPFEWIINEYSIKKDTEMNEGGRQCSPPFYISYAGYRVRLVAYLNGNGEGRTTHLAVYFCIMKGVNDAVLDWPFKQKVTLRLVDRKFGTSLLKKVVEPKSFTLGDDSFQRPVFEENVGRGYPKFISHEELEAVDSRYLLKDSIIVTAEFERAEITEE